MHRNTVEQAQNTEGSRFWPQCVELRWSRTRETNSIIVLSLGMHSPRPRVIINKWSRIENAAWLRSPRALAISVSQLKRFRNALCPSLCPAAI